MTKFLLAAATLTLSLTAQAQYGGYSSSPSFSFNSGANHEITTNMTNGGFFSGKKSENGKSGTAIVLSGSYLRYLKSNIQAGGEVAFYNYSEEISPVNKATTAFDLVAVGVYNVDTDIKNSIYAKGGVGLYSVPNSSNDGYESQFGFFLGAGKRFAWLSNVSYTPELRLTKRGNIDMAVEIALLNFSILW